MSASSSTTITPEVQQLLKGKNFASFATLMKDGSPQVTPVWIDTDGQAVLVNTAAGRTKEKNVKSDSRVALSVYDSANPYNMATIRAGWRTSRSRGPTRTSTSLPSATWALTSTRSGRRAKRG